VSTAESSRVLLRGYADKPGRATLLSVNGYIARVCGKTGAMPIGFPVTMVFSYDEALYNALRRASMDSDQKKLERLWRRANPIDSQNKL